MPVQDVPRTDAPEPEDFEDEAVREPFTRAMHGAGHEDAQ